MNNIAITRAFGARLLRLLVRMFYDYDYNHHQPWCECTASSIPISICPPLNRHPLPRRQGFLFVLFCGRFSRVVAILGVFGLLSHPPALRVNDSFLDPFSLP